jgi:hypothetical protein
VEEGGVSIAIYVPGLFVALSGLCERDTSKHGLKYRLRWPSQPRPN